MSAERERIDGFGRLEDGLLQASDWYLWGPYVSERQWGTVREDYSADGAAWDYLSHDEARSRAYRWGEDGLAGFCDIHQRLCLGLALWNGRDPILKERAFGLTGAQGNHGEDVKEYWWYLDAVPSHAWNRWRYHYPQGPFPYQDLIDTNGARNRQQPEYELLDTGAFDGDRYWIVEVAYAKADPDDLLMAISVTNAGPDAATVHVLPTAWFRNTWSSADDDSAKPVLAGLPDATAVSIAHPFRGELELTAGTGPDGRPPDVLFCENETNVARLFGSAPVTPYPKDGINDHVIHAAPTVNPGRTGRWRSFDAFDIMSMPDKWEYPWFAAWDLAFHCVALAHVDPAFAKYQLILLCREWFQHPNGALPAYEWDFSDVNPPVQAWAALEVFAVDGGRDLGFLSRVFDKLLVNFTWWVNREDAEGNNLFEGGFLGLDNIGPIDRSHLPAGGILEQSDATGWMGFYAIAMAGIAAVLHRSGARPAIDLVVKFLEHFAAITQAMDGQGMWDDADGLYYDKLLTADGTAVPVKVRSMVGIIPALAAAVIDEPIIERSRALGKHFADLLDRRGLRDRDKLAELGLMRGEPGNQRLLLSVAGVERLEKIFAKLFDEREFLSRYGLRALSAYHREHPYELDVEGVRATIDYEPAESTTAMFGGNSNWRGPLWFPLNYLVINVLERYYEFFGDDLTFEYPTRSGHQMTIDAIAADLQDRLISIFLAGADGRRPRFGRTERLQQDPAWKDNLMFSEYFHGDNGAGLGASHQTGWTGLIADVIRRRHGGVRALGDVLRNIEPEGRP